MRKKMRKGIVFGIVLTATIIAFAAMPHQDNWDVPGDLTGWIQNSGTTHVEVVDTGGNPDGYLFTESTGPSGTITWLAGAQTTKGEFTGDYNFGQTIQLSVDLNVISGLDNLSYDQDYIWIRFRYDSASANGWYYELTKPLAMGEWNTYTATFDPDWTDIEAESAGWIQEQGCPSFSETMANVYSAEVRFRGHGPIEAGIDNFSVSSDSGDIFNVPLDYTTIQAAIDAAWDGDTVLVADGTYTGPGNKDLNFNGKAITVMSVNGPENCIIDCEDSGRGFEFITSEGEGSVVSGFTISNGDADWGGGIYLFYASPTITNCKIIGSNADYDGGGIYSFYSHPTITNCTIRENNAVLFGGGIYCRDSSPTILACIINGNTAGASGGGIYCYFLSPSITNCIISGNYASEFGGGIALENTLYLTITNCTISGNHSYLGGGGIDCYNASPNITNSILRANYPNELSLYDAIPIFSYCNIQGGFTGTGNIDSDPLFFDVSDPEAANWDLHLKFSSPCIDTGTDTGDLPGSDFEGDPRILDGDNDGTPIVDMGADEYVWIDDDSDGIPDSEEMGPDGNDPNYDGNSDGSADSEQDNVASFHTYDGQSYVTLASPHGTTLSRVQAIGNPSPVDAPAGVDFPYGFFEFNVNGVVPGGAAAVTLYLPDAAPTTYYKYGPTLDDSSYHWYEFMDDGQTGASISGNEITLYFQDGLRGDADLGPNGIIVDPSGPVDDFTPPTIQLSDPVCVNVGPGKGKMANKLTVSASDNCSDLTFISIDKVEVYNNGGKLVQGNGVYESHGDVVYVYPNGEGWSVKVTATAEDRYGNSGTQTLEKDLIKCKK